MSFAVIVPARLAATRLPGKPLAEIAGVPMIVRVLQRAQAAGASRVIAAAADKEIAEAAAAAGFDCCMTPACDSGSARVAAAAQQYNFSAAEIVVNVQGDEPFIEPQVIADTAALLAQTPSCVCATAMRVPHNDAEFFDPAAVKVLANKNNTAHYFCRAPIPFAENTAPPSARIHIGVYAYRMPFLRQLPSLPPAPWETVEKLEQLRMLWHGYEIALLETASQSFGVDTPADLQRARQLAAK